MYVKYESLTAQKTRVLLLAPWAWLIFHIYKLYSWRCIYNVLIKPYLHNNIITVADYCYNYLAKQHVSALLGHHQAYKTVVLLKVHTIHFEYAFTK
jgi:hypothetical protein